MVKLSSKNQNKTPIIMISATILFILIVMAIILSRVSRNFYKSVVACYFAALFINTIVLILITNQKIKQDNIKIVSIIIVIVSIIYTIFISVFLTNKYGEYNETRNRQINDMMSEYRCKTQYNGYWSSYEQTCYYKDRNGKSRRINP